MTHDTYVTNSNNFSLCLLFLELLYRFHVYQLTEWTDTLMFIM